MPTRNELMDKSVSPSLFSIFSPQVKNWTGAILILCVMASFGCSNDPEGDSAAVQESLMHGWAAYDEGDFSAALLHFERVIELDTTRADAYNGLGWTHLSISREPVKTPEVLANAQETFERAIRVDTSNADAWIGLADTLFLRRESDTDFQTALRAIDNALQGDHRTLFRHDYHSAADLYTFKATCYYYLGQLNLARSAVGSALQTEPSNMTALSLQSLLK